MRTYALVAAGAAVGAGLRWWANEAIAHPRGGFPWSTLAVNLAGCLLAGLAVRFVVGGSDRWLTLVTGLLGGLTTYSAFAVETHDLLGAGRPALAAVYVVASIAGGIGAVELGRGGGRR